MVGRVFSTGAVLAGRTVVDLCCHAPGPDCGMPLADRCADVIHVEPPGGSLVEIVVKNGEVISLIGAFASSAGKAR